MTEYREFNRLDEFLDYLRLWRVDHNTVMVIIRFLTFLEHPGRKAVRLVVTARRGEVILRFGQYCGVLEGLDCEADIQALRRSQRVRARLETACKGLGIVVESGIYLAPAPGAEPEIATESRH